MGITISFDLQKSQKKNEDEEKTKYYDIYLRLEKFCGLIYDKPVFEHVKSTPELKLNSLIQALNSKNYNNIPNELMVSLNFAFKSVLINIKNLDEVKKNYKELDLKEVSITKENITKYINLFKIIYSNRTKIGKKKIENFILEIENILTMYREKNENNINDEKIQIIITFLKTIYLEDNEEAHSQSDRLIIDETGRNL